MSHPTNFEETVIKELLLDIQDQIKFALDGLNRHSKRELTKEEKKYIKEVVDIGHGFKWTLQDLDKEFLKYEEAVESCSQPVATNCTSK